MNVGGKLHLRVDAALNDELAGLSEDQARQVARSTMPVGSVMTVAGWLLLGGADGGPSGWVGSIAGRPLGSVSSPTAVERKCIKAAIVAVPYRDPLRTGLTA